MRKGVNKPTILLKVSIKLVPLERLELPTPFENYVLSVACLPIPPQGHKNLLAARQGIEPQPFHLE